MRRFQTTVLLTMVRGAAVCCVMMAVPMMGLAQEPILGNKKQLVTELVEVMQLGQTAQKTFEVMMGQMETQLPQMMVDMATTNKDMTAEQREHILDQVKQSQGRFAAKFKERMSGVYSSQKFFDEVYYPAFAKYYSETELRDIIAFYKTPTGQKMLLVQPEFTADVIQRTFDSLGPKIQQLTKELMDEEMERIKKQKADSK